MGLKCKYLLKLYMDLVEITDFDSLPIIEKTVAYVINLDKRPERWQTIQERFKDSSIILERISAVEDSSNGHNGCGLSFLKIIAAAKAQGLENVLIFEDDNTPLDNFDKRWAITKEWLDTHTDKWEIFNGGGQVPDDLSRYPSWKLSATPLFKNNTLNVSVCKINNLVRTNFMYISNRAYNKILTWTWNNHRHIDCFMNDAANFNTVAIYPMLCTQEDAKFSNTTNSVRDLKTLDDYSNSAFMEALWKKSLHIVAENSFKTTIVTAIYKIPSKQPFEFYLEKFKLFISHMPHPIVVFTSKDTYNQIQSIIVESKKSNIIIYTLEVDEFMLTQIASREMLEAHVKYFCNSLIPNASSELLSIYFQKSFFVSSVIEKNPFSSSWFIWNDCGSIRNTQWLKYVDTSYNIDSLESTEHVYLQLGHSIDPSDYNTDINGLRGIKLPFKNIVCGAIMIGSSSAWKQFTSKLLNYTQKIIDIHSKNRELLDTNTPILYDEDLYHGVLMNYPNVAKGIFTDNIYKYMDYDGDYRNDPKWFGFYCIFSSICDYKYTIMDSSKFNIEYIKIIASMTTIPSRIAHIKPVLECILNQTVPVKHIEINIPEKCIRTGETYLIPEWLTTMPRVKIFRTPDYGPITKVAPTFLRSAGDTSTYIWSCDDDRLYPPNTLRSLTNGIDHFSNEARGAAPGITVCEDGFALLENYDSSPSYLQGYGTVLYAPNLIQDDFMLYLKFTQTSKDCRFQDEPVIFNYLAKYNILLKTTNPYNINFCSKKIITDHESVPEALCRVEGTHAARVVRILEFLQQEDLLYLQLKSKKIRLHILGIPHTVTNSQYSHCAFTGKVQRFAPMMRPLDYEVYHYGNAGSESGATKDICILSASELELLEIQSLKYLHPSFSDTDIKNILNDKRRIVGDLARWDTPLYKEFNRRLKIELKKYYRSNATDIVCNPYGRSYTEALNDLDIVKVECGIGYKDPCEAWRIYESYAWFHSSMALEGHNGTYKNYWYVIPQSFNILEWPLNLNPTPKKVGFLGRIGPGKGCHLIVDIARRFPDVEFIICGGGDPNPYLQLPNIKFKPQIHGTERATYLGSLVALIAPTQYVEPYGCISPEAQLCGTPVIAPDSGGFTETVIHMKTGLLCHTLADYCLGIQLALDGQFDRSYIRTRAVERYDMTVVAHKWDQAFKSILDMSNGAGGWYGEKCHIKCEKNITPSYKFNENQSTPLCEIMGRNSSDKGSININTSYHNYTTFYYSIFKELSNKKLRIFELGLGTNNVNILSNMGANGVPGASLYGWQEFFPNSEIFGADIDNHIQFNTDKIKTFYCDQTKPEIIQKMWTEPSLEDDFDIIIEDGLHEFYANVCFFENSIHKLKPNGYYIIEDINISIEQQFINKIKEWEAKYKDCTFTLLKIPSTVNYMDNILCVVKKLQISKKQDLTLTKYLEDANIEGNIEGNIGNSIEKMNNIKEILDTLDYEELDKSINYNNFEKKIYSQNGEDGITMKLLELVYNDPYNKYYVEFGAENGKECNSRILMENYGWKGLLMDGTYWNHLINLQKEFITKENIVELFKKYSVPKKINLLSVDIDYNDFYVLHSILKEYLCDIIICEYNSTHLAHEDKIIIYSATSGWDGTNYFGASLYSLQKLGELYNYSLVCCDSRGVNCFFIHNDIVKKKNIVIDPIEKIYRKAEYGPGPNGGHRQDMQYRKYISFNEAIN